MKVTCLFLCLTTVLTTNSYADMHYADVDKGSHVPYSDKNIRFVIYLFSLLNYQRYHNA